MVVLRITVTKEGELPTVSIFDEREVKIGRTKANDLVIADLGVSSAHACVRSSDDGITLIDLGSTNGTFVNGERIRDPTLIRPGDEVYICNCRLDFELMGSGHRTDDPPPLDGPPPLVTTFDVFVSYDGTEPFVTRSCQALERAGLRLWLDERGSVTEARHREMERVLRAGVRLILVFVGARGFAFPQGSPRHLLFESASREHSTPVVGILLPDAAWQWLPKYVDDWRWLDLREESTWEWGIETITTWVRRPMEVPPARVPVPMPAPGAARAPSPGAPMIQPPIIQPPVIQSPTTRPLPAPPEPLPTHPPIDVQLPPPLVEFASSGDALPAPIDISDSPPMLGPPMLDPQCGHESRGDPEPPPLLPRPTSISGSMPEPEYPSFDVARGDDVQVPAAPERHVNTGFSTLYDGTPWPRDRSLDCACSYLFWLEIGPQVQGAIETKPIVLPETVPEGAVIDVVLFGEPGGFETNEAVGRLVLEGARGRVLTQPTLRALDHLGALPRHRLFFEVRTPAEPGSHHLACNLYHRGVLLQSIDVSAQIGTRTAWDGPALFAVPHHVLSHSLSDELLQANRQHVLSIVQGLSRNGDAHSFQFYGDQTARGSAHIDDHLIQNLLDMARKTYREVSWGSPEPYDPERPDDFCYRYDDNGDFVRLEQDLVRLAKAGFRSWDRVAQGLAQVHGTHLEKRALRERMLAPGGRIQFGLHDSPRSVLPLALFYDHKLQASATSGLRLCPTFRRTLNEDPLETPCFREPCEHHEDPLTVCPSGFWGFRHAIGFTPSMGTRELCPVIAVGPSAVVHAVVWAEPDLRLRDAHVEALRQRFSGSALELAEHRGAAIELFERGGSPLVYFYCHGGANDIGPYLRVGTQADDPIEPSDFANLASPWISPRPLVFINGCHTTNLEPERAFEFVSALVEQGAVGVMGTEITVFEPLATRFAETFFAKFSSGTEAGEAVRLARLELLGRSLNPLGLLYVPYMLSTIRMARASA